MPNYYEILKVAPNATATEIQSAYEAQRAQLEQFLNHPDAETASKAQKGVQFLQQVSVIMLDPEKRKAYDASIGLVSGLADPQATISPISLFRLRHRWLQRCPPPSQKPP